MHFSVLTLPAFIRPTPSSFKKHVKFQPTASLIFTPQQVEFVPVYFVIILFFLFGCCVAYGRPDFDVFLFVSEFLVLKANPKIAYWVNVSDWSSLLLVSEYCLQQSLGSVWLKYNSVENYSVNLYSSEVCFNRNLLFSVALYDHTVLACSSFVVVSIPVILRRHGVESHLLPWLPPAILVHAVVGLILHKKRSQKVERTLIAVRNFEFNQDSIHVHCIHCRISCFYHAWQCLYFIWAWYQTKQLMKSSKSTFFLVCF